MSIYSNLLNQKLVLLIKSIPNFCIFFQNFVFFESVAILSVEIIYLCKDYAELPSQENFRTGRCQKDYSGKDEAFVDTGAFGKRV